MELRHGSCSVSLLSPISLCDGHSASAMAEVGIASENGVIGFQMVVVLG
jgi:hypothetical protein